MGQGFQIYNFFSFRLHAAIFKDGGLQNKMSQYLKRYVTLSSFVDDIGYLIYT